MRAYLVSVETQDGLQLDGALKEPSQAGASQMGIDGVILVHGTGGNFYHPSMFDHYSDALVAKGCAALRINTRGHDMIAETSSNADRQYIGSTYEGIDECRFDLRAWITFLRSVGYQKIGLWGHSLGALKAIYYMALEQDPNVKCVVAASPPRFSYKAFVSMPEGEEFLNFYTTMQRQVEAGKPGAIVDVPIPYPYIATAGQYVEKYGPDERYNILTYLPKLHCPTLITIGNAEAQTLMAFRGLPEEVERLTRGREQITFTSIPGADHFYTRQRGYLWEVVNQWLSKV